MYKYLACLFLLLTSACASKLEYDYTKLSINPDVKLISIDTNSVRRGRDGQLLAQVSGISKKNQLVYYKFVWFDDSGMKISTSLSQWNRANLREGADFYWKAVAPSKRAVTYKVNVTDDIGNGLVD